MKKTILVILILLAVGTLSYGAYYFFYHKTHASIRQAVFMTNGQVYFGYLSNPSGQVVTLRNIYYLKTQDLDETANSNKKIVLVKLGNELHNPQDIMYINRDQILFYQNLRPESRINDAINKFVQKENTNSSTANN